MANYSNDQDLVKIRPNILKYKVTDWEDHHVEATREVNQVLEVRWYKEHAAEQGVDWTSTRFNPDLVDADFVRRLTCYKALELIYLFLMKDEPDEDAFEKQMFIFRDLYDAELQTVLVSGLGYDWDASGTVDADERLAPRIRRQMRM
jgi:hypothetical protein